MILFYTPNSPYARTARIALRERGILDIAEERLAINRSPDNPVLRFSPVGRVPTLVHEGLVITEARSVFAFIAAFGGAEDASSRARPDWATLAEEGQIAGFLEGIATWVRENRRPVDKRSDFLLDVERDRARRCLDHLEARATAGPLPDVDVFGGAALAVALHQMEVHGLAPGWRSENDTLAGWFGRQLERPSMRETAPEI
jgi:glutathione S-transferase